MDNSGWLQSVQNTTRLSQGPVIFDVKVESSFEANNRYNNVFNAAGGLMILLIVSALVLVCLYRRQRRVYNELMDERKEYKQ